MSDIVQDYVENYIRGLLPAESPYFERLRLIAETNHVPIIFPEVRNYLEMLIVSQNIKSVLEIGTAVGYSAGIFAQAMGEGGRVVTIDRDERMLAQARANIEAMGYKDRITILEGDAQEQVAALKGSFDMVFLDGGKGHYIHLLEDCLRLLKPGGLLVSDNVLYKGMIATNELVIRRKITIVKRMRKYLEALTKDDRLITTILPLGDGLSVSYKK
ncbi:MAG: O-methyltransferase [Eubacterium sp.]|nr:O-methyltransferase [Eubacterium sp.]